MFSARYTRLADCRLVLDCGRAFCMLKCCVMANMIITPLSPESFPSQSRSPPLVSSLMPGTRAHRAERSKTVAKAPQSALGDSKGYGAALRHAFYW
jgi:hypothetical protein